MQTGEKQLYYDLYFSMYMTPWLKVRVMHTAPWSGCECRRCLARSSYIDICAGCNPIVRKARCHGRQGQVNSLQNVR